jgi:hypothetical protein
MKVFIIRISLPTIPTATASESGRGWVWASMSAKSSKEPACRHRRSRRSDFHEPDSHRFVYAKAVQLGLSLSDRDSGKKLWAGPVF